MLRSFVCVEASLRVDRVSLVFFEEGGSGETETGMSQEKDLQASNNSRVEDLPDTRFPLVKIDDGLSGFTRLG